MAYKVVCEDCPFESEEDVSGVAKYLRDMHLLMKGHDAEVREVA